MDISLIITWVSFGICVSSLIISLVNFKKAKKKNLVYSSTSKDFLLKKLLSDIEFNVFIPRIFLDIIERMIKKKAPLAEYINLLNQIEEKEDSAIFFSEKTSEEYYRHKNLAFEEASNLKKIPEEVKLYMKVKSNV